MKSSDFGPTVLKLLKFLELEPTEERQALVFAALLEATELVTHDWRSVPEEYRQRVVGAVKKLEGEFTSWREHKITGAGESVHACQVAQRLLGVDHDN